MQEQLQAKQKYLREHIIDQNYDPEDFAQYCLNDIGNIDMNLWTFQDLQNIVKKYKQSKKVFQKTNQQTSSFINYQQQQIQHKSHNHKQPEIEKPIQIKVQKQSPKPVFINHDQIKQIFKSPKIEKPQQKSIDQLFKDPFSLKLSSPQKQNSWLPPDHNKTQSFDFMGILGKPSEQLKPQIKKNDKQFQNIFNSFQVQIPTQPNYNFQFNSSVNQHINKGNLNIFDLNFQEFKKQNPKSSQSHKSNNLKQIPQPFYQQQKITPNVFVKVEQKNNQKIEKVVKTQKIQKVQKPIEKQKRNKVKYEGPKVVKQQMQDVVSCTKAIARNLLSDPNLEVQITGHQIVNRNFFVPDYVLYHVFTKGINSQVKRKYNYFYRLRNMLAKFYPGHRLPYLQKNSWLSQTDIEFIKKQKLMIQMFMNDVIMNNQFKNCRIVQQFLTIKDKKTLKSKFEQYQNMPRLKSIQQLCLLDGQVNVKYTDQHRIYSEKLEVYLQNIETNIEKYKRLCDQLTSNYGVLLKTFSEINEVMGILQTSTKTFNSSVQIGQFYDVQKVFHKLNEIYKQMGNNVKFQIKVLQAQIKPLFKFEKQNLNTIRQLSDIKNRLTQSYNKLIESNPKVETYNNNKKLDQFKIQISEGSKNYTVLKYQTAFYNNQYVTQNVRMFNDMGIKINKKFISIGSMYEQKHNQILTFWKNIRNVGLK